MIREVLIKLRKFYDAGYVSALKKLTPALALTIIIAIIMDTLLPFTMLFNFLRAFVSLILIILLFTVGYLFTLDQHYKKIETVDDWLPYRARMSFTLRRNISLIIGAFLIVFMYGTGYTPVYTVLSSAYIAIALGLIVFVRKTSREELQDYYSIPDLRDKEFNEYYENYKQEKKNKKKRKRA